MEGLMSAGEARRRGGGGTCTVGGCYHRTLANPERKVG